MRLGLFGGGRDRQENAARTAALKREIALLLDLDEDVAIAVNEIVCADPACPGTETVILIMKPGEKTHAYKVQAPLDEVTGHHLRGALARPPD